MLVNIDEEEIEFCDLLTEAVFNHNGITYMRVNAIEFDPEDEVTEEEDEGHPAFVALNLATLLVEYFNPNLKIPARCVFKPTEITFK